MELLTPGPIILPTQFSVTPNGYQVPVKNFCCGHENV